MLEAGTRWSAAAVLCGEATVNIEEAATAIAWRMPGEATGDDVVATTDVAGAGMQLATAWWRRGGDWRTACGISVRMAQLHKSYESQLASHGRCGGLVAK